MCCAVRLSVLTDRRRHRLSAGPRHGKDPAHGKDPGLGKDPGHGKDLEWLL